MKKIYKKPIMHSIFLDGEICEIVSQSATLNVHDREDGVVDGGMTRQLESPLGTDSPW